MAIGKVPGADHLLAVMRASLSPRRSGHGIESEGPASLVSVPPIRQRLAALVQKASPQTPEDWASLRPVLVQAILIEALGPEISRHPEFPTLLRALDEALEQQSSLWEGAITELTRQAKKSP